MNSIVRDISEEERLEIYDRLATKWVEKMEVQKRHQQLINRHPGLIISSAKNFNKHFSSKVESIGSRRAYI